MVCSGLCNHANLTDGTGRRIKGRLGKPCLEECGEGQPEEDFQTFRKWEADFLQGKLDWQERAACRGVQDPDIFFPQKNELHKGNEAITLCFSCDVRAECEMYRKSTRTQYGIWAGQYTKRTGTDDD